LPAAQKEPHPEAEIPDHIRHQHVDAIADDVFEEVSGQTEVGFEMADDRRLCRINIL
jgi:hypothetical protein